jgi:hypothetical protein
MIYGGKGISFTLYGNSFSHINKDNRAHIPLEHVLSKKALSLSLTEKNRFVQFFNQNKYIHDRYGIFEA